MKKTKIIKGNEELPIIYSDCSNHDRCNVCGFCIDCGSCRISGCGYEAKIGMKFINYATGNIINAKPVQSQKYEIVYSQELDKHFRVIRRKRRKTRLHKTSYFLVGEKQIRQGGKDD